MNTQDEKLVYVIENEQPFINWTGVLVKLGPITCEVLKDDEDEPISVPTHLIQDVDTGENVWEQHNTNVLAKDLNERGLNDEEAKQFLTLLKKIKPTDEDEEAFDEEAEEPISFEGGMGFTEALTALRWTLD